MQAGGSASTSNRDCAAVTAMCAPSAVATAHCSSAVTTECHIATPAPVSDAAKDCDRDAAPVKRSPQDFRFGEEIGCGSFSTVYVAKEVASGREVAIKVCLKRHIIRERKQAYVIRERDVLNHVSQNGRYDTPFFVQLRCTFQDAERLYFVLSFAKRGELLSHLTKVGTFDAAVAQFYMSELVHAVEHLHRIGVIHRDLKPENILLSEYMHILVSDFGSAKTVTHSECPMTLDTVQFTSAGSSGQTSTAAAVASRKSFVGTAEYASPELLQEKVTSHASDLWALGCILYQMVSGLAPFRSRSQYLVFKKILVLEYEFPAEGFPGVSADLVRRLLVLEPAGRLGAGDSGSYVSIKRHAFFDGVQFEALYLQKPPEIYPYLPGTAEHPELRSTYRVPDDLEPGLCERQLTQGLFNLSIDSVQPVVLDGPTAAAARTTLTRSGNMTNLSAEEVRRRLAQQEHDNQWHRFVEGNVIIKQGFLEKRKGLFARRRMFLLTTGPRLFYVDPTSMVLKGEVPITRELRAEAKNFKNMFVHTPGRTYYLEDPEGYALEWVKAIDEVRLHAFGDKAE